MPWLGEYKQKVKEQRTVARLPDFLIQGFYLPVKVHKELITSIVHPNTRGFVQQHF